MYAIIFCMLLVVLLQHDVRAATIPAASCSQGDVQTAVNTATDTDTVTIPAGSCTWTSAVSWTDKNIEVIGNGIGSTNLTSVSNTMFSIAVNDPAKGSFRVSSLTIDGTPTGNPNIIFINTTNTTSIVSGWRFDNIRFNFTNQTSLRAFLIDGITFGVIHDCTFDGGSYLGVHSRAFTQNDFTSGNPNGTDSYNAVPFGLGNANAIYIEDNDWNLTPSGLPFVNDMDFGARQVFRFNTVDGAIFQSHSARSNDRGGSLKFEIYGNTFTGLGFFRVMLIRSGTGVIYENTVSGYTNNNFDIDNQRSSTEAGCFVIGPPLGRCDGTSIWDGNVGPPAGWPCLDQIGRGGGAPGSQPADAAYAWTNGPESTCATGGTCSDTSVFQINGSCPSSGSWIQLNRDYFNNAGVKPGYTAFTYPHPLRGGAANFTVGGTVSGLTGGTLILQNNGIDDETITVNGVYTFDTALPDSSAYNVTVFQQPAGQNCIVSNASGTIMGANVTDVDVTCTPIVAATGQIQGASFIGASILEAPDIESGKVLELKFDGDLLDTSGNGNDGTFFGGSPTYTTNIGSLPGQAIDFDGADDRVEVAADATINSMVVLSFGVFLNFDTFGESDVGRIWGKEESGVDTGPLFFLRPAGDTSFSQFNWPTVGGWRYPVASMTTATDYCVVFTYDGNSTANDPVLYLNGVSQAVSEPNTPAGTFGTDDTVDLQIGNRSDGARAFDGRMARFTLWNRILTTEQVNYFCNQGGLGT